MNYPSFLPEITAATTIEQLQHDKLLSKKACLFCDSSGLKTVGELMAFRLKHFNFLGQAWTCGQRTDEELGEFCRRFSHVLEGKEALKADTALFAPALDEVRLESFHRYMNEAAKRFQSRLRLLFLTDNIQRFYREYIQGEKSFRFLKNVGIISIVDLEKFRNELRDYAYQLQGMPASFEFDQFIETCTTHFGCRSEEMEVFRKFADAGKFPLFGFIAYLIDGGHLFNKGELFLLKHGMGWIRGHELYDPNIIMDEIGIRGKAYGNMISFMPVAILNYLKPLSEHASFLKQHIKYGLDFNATVLYFNEAAATQLNHAEGANLHPCFYSVITWALFQRERSLFACEQGSAKNIYFIRKDVADAFHLGSFFKKYWEILGQYQNNKEWAKIVKSLNSSFRQNAHLYAPIVEAIITTILSEEINPSQSGADLDYILGSNNRKEMSRSSSKSNAA